MKPSEAGFDGAKGLVIGGGGRQIYQLKRGKKIPDINKYNHKNQLLWYYPDNQDPKLFYCSKNNMLFELDFIPVEPWTLLLETINEDDDD